MKTSMNGVKPILNRLVNFDPSVGKEIKKTRPCVVVSPDEINQFLRTIVVAPMKTNLKKYPIRIKVNHNNKRGMIAIDQIRTIDKKRVLKKFDHLTKSEIKHCKSIIK